MMRKRAILFGIDSLYQPKKKFFGKLAFSSDFPGTFPTFVLDSYGQSFKFFFRK